jgi:glutamine amidotransferase
LYGWLGEHELLEPVLEFIRSGRPYLGICLGLQLLLTESEEFGCHKGMNILQGRVRRFPHRLTNTQGHVLKVPHMGWNQAHVARPAPIFDGIPEYLFFCTLVLYRTAGRCGGGGNHRYGYTLCLAFGMTAYLAYNSTRKSQTHGLRVLKNFGDIARSNPVHWCASPVPSMRCGGGRMLIPAVDLKNGRCVRLRQGRMDAETIYSDDPVAMAQGWVGRGGGCMWWIDGLLRRTTQSPNDPADRRNLVRCRWVAGFGPLTALNATPGVARSLSARWRLNNVLAAASADASLDA